MNSCCASSQVGHAKRVELSKESTTLIGGAGKSQQIQDRIASIKRQWELASSDYDRDKLEERVAKLAGGVALIKVGATTETERKERKLRVEDALHATRAAVQEGIVAGGGVALFRARRVLMSMSAATLDETSGIRLVARALEEPIAGLWLQRSDRSLRRFAANGRDRSGQSDASGTAKCSFHRQLDSEHRLHDRHRAKTARWRRCAAAA